MKSAFQSLMFATVALMSGGQALADSSALTANAWCSAEMDLGIGIKISQRYEFHADGALVIEISTTGENGSVQKDQSTGMTWSAQGSELTVVDEKSESKTATTASYLIEPVATESGKVRLVLSAPGAPTMEFTSCN